MKFSQIKYHEKTIPTGYVCGTCGVTGYKLWRESGSFLSNQTLECVMCAGASQKKDVTSVDDYGTIDWNGIRIDQIGWRVPAVPTEDGSTMWGYTSVPSAGVKWWESLPTKPMAKL